MIQVSFILVEPGEAGNIGAAARAINTMGHTDLRLVRTKADPLSGIARAMAHGSEHILENAPQYEDLSDALGGIDLACASTARHRIKKYHYVSLLDLPHKISEKGDLVSKVAIVFGSERSGLSNQDIEKCDLVTTIPQSVAQPSLNLAQAVMLYSFTLAQSQTQVQIADQRLNRDRMPTEQYARLKSALQSTMAQIGLHRRTQTYVIQALARLSYEDLYLIQQIRTFVDNKINNK